MSAERRPPVVVLNTHYSGLGIARNLTPLGVRVIALTASAEFPGNRSRYLEYRPSPDSLAEPRALLEMLLRLAEELGERAALFPTRDHDIDFIDAHRAAIESAFLVPYAAPEVIRRTSSKDACAKAAMRCGVHVAKQVVIDASEETERARVLRFPCICRPVYSSRWRTPEMWLRVGRRKAVKCDDFDAFARFHAKFAQFDPAVVVQEWIPGPESHLRIFGSYTDRAHEVRAFFTAHKRLQYPELIGTGVIVEAQRHPELEAPSRALLRELAFYGISEIEYKVDSRDGSLNLIEVNPRHWDQHRLGTAVGVNLSLAAYEDALGRPVPLMNQTPDTLRWIAEPEFAWHVLRCLAGRGSLREVRDLARAPRIGAIGDSTDPAPARAMWRGFARDVVRRLWA